MRRMSYPSDLTDQPWALPEPVFDAPGKRGPEHAPDLQGGRDAVRRPHRLPVALPARVVRTVDAGVVAVPPLVVPASTHENRASGLMLEHLSGQGVTGRLELVLVDRGVTSAAARTLSRHHELEVRRVGWDDKQPATDSATGRRRFRAEDQAGTESPCSQACQAGSSRRT
jgi:hypothetical protein